jgi:hypothetical protein
MRLRLPLILALTTLPACSSVPRDDSHEIFDEQSGNTVLVVAKPLVFARERTDVAAHARDYATLVGAELDESGKYSDFLLLYRWSTVDRRMSAPPGPDAGKLRILAEGRAIELAPLDRLPVSLSHRRELHVPERADVVARAYRIDVATLRFIADARDIVVFMPEETLGTPFRMWEDGRRSLQQFLQRAGAL